MKYLKLFEEYSNKWTLILSNPKKEINGKKLIELVNNAYKYTTFGSFVKNIKDVVKSTWLVIDYNEDDNIDACIFYRKERSDENWEGRKIQGIGHDDKNESKIYIIQKIVDLLNKNGTWIEASGKLEQILNSKNCKKVTDIKILKEIFPYSEIELLDNGQYKRNLKNDTIIIETLFGKPILKNK